MGIESKEAVDSPTLTFDRDTVIQHYRLSYQSRQASLIGRKEVLTGKAKFGIFGDGKELPQIAMASVFEPGDIRSGYYRDQTFVFATGMGTIEEFFAQLYANPDPSADIFSAGRQMNSHFATRNLNPDGSWKDMTKYPVSVADASPTASQMPRLAGLVQASKLYRILPELAEFKQFSNHGHEVAFGTIGNASTAEGHFWETLNAVGVIQGPLVMSIWDDDYGISVPNEHQITKTDLSEMLEGFRRREGERGFEIFQVKAWDYPALMETYRRATDLARNEHIPVVIHVTEVTQPQGHSTSGSHERYKSEERLAWERDHDCVTRFRDWVIQGGYATPEELDKWEKEDRKAVRKIKNEAWETFLKPINDHRAELIDLIQALKPQAPDQDRLQELITELERNREPKRRELMRASHQAILSMRGVKHQAVNRLAAWRKALDEEGQAYYNTHLYSEGEDSALNVEGVAPVYADDAPVLSGFEVLNKAFEHMLAKDPRIIAFGEDVGQLGDVNQGFAGLQEKFGEYRVRDTGIREATIIGQAIGLAMRGLRPIAEIQYLDYFIYGLQTLSDDLATLRYRTQGGQKAPAIIRTRGHRLEGIWHAGSPLGMIIHALRGVHICVPRDMTQAAGFYHTLLESGEPGVIIEVLNGYRLKEKLPSNLPEIRTPLGIPEVLREGDDVTVVTYGACVRIAQEAANQLAEIGIGTEVIDVQTLLPFDINGLILESLKKTNRIVFLDEDVPGGATGFMFQQVIEKQGGYYWLDSEPRTLTSEPHRPAYGDDGDYWSKPQVEDVFQAVYDLMNEAEPDRFPAIY